jgi:hypothetical protein
VAAQGCTVDERVVVTRRSDRQPRRFKRQLGFAAIREIKEGDAGRRAGAIFELLGLNLFYAPNQRVEPAPVDNPGYDGKVFLPDGSSLMLSIKNHGITAAELSFRANAEKINEAFLDAAARHGRNGLMNRIIATAHPGEADWRQLRDRTEGIVAGTYNPQDGIWNGSLQPFPAIYAPLSPHHLSYISTIAAPYHQNEQTNFFDNIRKGIANLVKHHAVVPDDVCRAVMLRLSASASVSKCTEWARTYFVDYPDTPVELILLYQAVPATNLVAGTISITHHLAPVFGPKYPKWHHGNKPRRFVIRHLIGELLANATRLVMTDGTLTIPMDDFYVFQKGRIYRYYAANVPVNMNLSMPAPDVFVHAVTEGIGLQMIAAPNAELLLLP